MNIRTIVKSVTVLGALLIGSVVVPSEAEAYDPTCTTTVEACESYYLGVVRLHQEVIDRLEGDVTYWHEAHDRVAAHAVARNFEYAEVVAERDRLRYTVLRKNSKIAELREALRELHGAYGDVHNAAGDPEEWPTMRLNSRVVCVISDFPGIGSGWKVKKAVNNWNAAQSTVRLTMSYEPGCAVVNVHRYSGQGEPFDSYCGYAAYDNWNTITEVDGVMEYDTSDVWLNDGVAGCRDTKRRSKTIVAHELGHAMGLPHVFEEPDNVMCYCYDLDLYRGKVGPQEAADLDALYNLVIPVEPPATKIGTVVK